MIIVIKIIDLISLMTSLKKSVISNPHLIDDTRKLTEGYEKALQINPVFFF